MKDIDDIVDLAEAKAQMELKEKDLFNVVMKSAHQTIEIAKLKRKLAEREATIKTLKEVIDKI
tara:strand:+ start:362 stop:550 length:189 start_codon:yes stop_codon:yes gene_type:complete